MKRVLLGLLLGVLIFGVAFAGAKVATVTNPMSANLDAGGYSIDNASQVTAGVPGATSGSLILGGFSTRGAISLFTGIDTQRAKIIGGYEDPSVNCIDTTPGSLWIRQAIDGSTGQLWFHPSTDPCNWTLLAGTP